MTNNDVSQIRQVLKEEIDEALNKRLSATEKIFDEKLAATENALTSSLDEKLTATRKDLTTVFDEKLAATENALTSSLDEKLTATRKDLTTVFDEKLAATEKRLKAEITESGDNIIEEIAGFMEVNLLPKLDSKADKPVVDRTERRIDHLTVKIGEYDVRLKNIETIPVVSHQLKIRKAKS